MLQARSVFLLAVLWAVSSAHGAVLSGADVLAEQDYSALHGRRVGVVASPATVLRNLTHLVDAMWASPAIDIRAVFGAEHGFRGTAVSFALEPGCATGRGASMSLGSVLFLGCLLSRCRVSSFFFFSFVFLVFVVFAIAVL
eukprot:m.32696 g.32696  ORF g.32696 m.32696 type:complete len:141 (-) comp5564_c0_seq1:1151-1573(-)